MITKNTQHSNHPKRPNALGWLLSGLMLLIASASIAVFIITATYRWVNPPLTWLMLDRYLFHEKTQHKPINQQWVRIDSISPHIVKAVIAAEDNLFMSHRGFDYKSIKEAISENKYGKRVRGASTISMQVSKNLFLWHDRTWTRKALEAGFTVAIETIWSKKRIMEVYLNIAEFGPSIYGVEAASQVYFKKGAIKINRNEASLLATVLPNPLLRNPKSPSLYMLNYQQRILRNMNNIGEIDLLDRQNLKKK